MSLFILLNPNVSIQKQYVIITGLFDMKKIPVIGYGTLFGHFGYLKQNLNMKSLNNFIKFTIGFIAYLIRSNTR